MFNLNMKAIGGDHHILYKITVICPEIEAVLMFPQILVLTNAFIMLARSLLEFMHASV